MNPRNPSFVLNPMNNKIDQELEFDSDADSLALRTSTPSLVAVNPQSKDEVQKRSSLSFSHTFDDYSKNETCCKYFSLRKGLLALCMLLLVDTIIEFIICLLFSMGKDKKIGNGYDISSANFDAGLVIPFLYVAFLLWMGIIGIIAIGRNILLLVRIFLFGCLGNIVIQLVLSVWICILYAPTNEVYMLVILVLDVFITILLWLYLAKIVHKYERLLKQHYVALEL
ncbi:hypothetical protein RFI_19625 [Reticulomyxa filosa]|uniref:Uncharacterized protein n=1 Tax=Reticulomyxa filosa TaxID=46433 RepID=X6MVL6_RETFI|nr:hypothetical protein RFI_19625 [Reticulomyxa filosa]|eukprot:ETO17691.1 hypothetical protein RFI_19625 [Reticulomyxa filosa]